MAVEFSTKDLCAKEIALLVAQAAPHHAELSEYVIESLLDNGRTLKVLKGQQVSGRSDKQVCFYIVLNGSVRICINNMDGREFVLSFMTAGTMWGLRPCLMNESRSHDTYAETDATVLAVTNSVIFKLMRDDEQIMRAIVTILCKRVKYVSDAIEQFAIRTTHQQLAWRLLELNNSHGQESNEEVTTLDHISQHSLAAMIGKSRQSTNKVLKEFERDGIIAIHYNQIVIRDSLALEKILEG